VDEISIGDPASSFPPATTAFVRIGAHQKPTVFSEILRSVNLAAPFRPHARMWPRRIPKSGPLPSLHLRITPFDSRSSLSITVNHGRPKKALCQPPLKRQPVDMASRRTGRRAHHGPSTTRGGRRRQYKRKRCGQSGGDFTKQSQLAPSLYGSSLESKGRKGGSLGFVQAVRSSPRPFLWYRRYTSRCHSHLIPQAMAPAVLHAASAAKRIALVRGFRLLGGFRLRGSFQRLGSCGYR
jgi:hypothetical protein